MGLDVFINRPVQVSNYFFYCQFIIKFDVGQSSHTTLAYYVEI